MHLLEEEEQVVAWASSPGGRGGHVLMGSPRVSALCSSPLGWQRATLPHRCRGGRYAYYFIYLAFKELLLKPSRRDPSVVLEGAA